MCFPRGDLTAITLCGPAVECSACKFLPPVREQFGPCSRAHAAIGQQCLAASICWRATSSFCQTQDACAAQLSHERFAATQQQSRLIMSCVCHVAHARVERSGPRVPLCLRCHLLFVLGCSLLVLLVSGTLPRKSQSKCRRSVVKSEHHGRLSVAPVAKHNPCPFDGTHGMQTRQTCLCCCFFFFARLFVGICPCALTWFSFNSEALR